MSVCQVCNVFQCYTEYVLPLVLVDERGALTRMSSPVAKLTLGLGLGSGSHLHVVPRDKVTDRAERGCLYSRRRVLEKLDESHRGPRLDDRLDVLVGAVGEVGECPAGIGEDLKGGRKGV